METGHHFVHIYANDSGYVYVGAYGALRSPPSTGGRFLSEEFIIHWPDINQPGDPWGDYGQEQYVDICVSENTTVNVTIIPVNASTGEVSQFEDSTGNITFSLTGNGIHVDAVCRHVRVNVTGNSSPGLNSTTAIIRTTGGNISIEMFFPEEGYCRAYSGSGNIMVVIPVHTSVQVDALTKNGEVNVAENFNFSDVEDNGNSFKGTLETGAGEIYLRTDFGNINLISFEE